MVTVYIREPSAGAFPLRAKGADDNTGVHLHVSMDFNVNFDKKNWFAGPELVPCMLCLQA